MSIQWKITLLTFWETKWHYIAATFYKIPLTFSFELSSFAPGIKLSKGYAAHLKCNWNCGSYTYTQTSVHPYEGYGSSKTDEGVRKWYPDYSSIRDVNNFSWDNHRILKVHCHRLESKWWHREPAYQNQSSSSIRWIIFTINVQTPSAVSPATAQAKTIMQLMKWMIVFQGEGRCVQIWVFNSVGVAKLI